jgi:hypothetical protein
MPAIGLLGLAAVVLAIALALFAPRVFAAAPPPAGSTPKPAAADPAAPAAPLTREQLKDKLQKLAETPPPAQLSFGAKCYDQAAPPETADFVCPRDGSRTQYTRNAAVASRVRSLPALRQEAAALPGLSATIDDSELCRKCTPKAPDDPQLVLVVRLPDGGEKRTRGATRQDLQLLREFALDSVKHEGEQGRETPLKDSLPRLRELLGLDKQGK